MSLSPLYLFGVWDDLSYEPLRRGASPLSLEDRGKRTVWLAPLVFVS